MIRSETGVLKIAVETVLPFHCTVRGSPRLTEMTFIGGRALVRQLTRHGKP